MLVMMRRLRTSPRDPTRVTLDVGTLWVLHQGQSSSLAHEGRLEQSVKRMEAKQIQMFGTLHRLLDSTIEALEASLQVLQKPLDKLEKETSVAAASTAEGSARADSP